MKRGKIAIDGVDTFPEVVAPEEERDAEQAAAADESPSAAGYAPPPRRPKAERKNAFDFSAWLVEGVLGLAEEVRHNDLGLPAEFWIHAYAARREALLAARALVDTALEQCDETTPSRAKARRQRGRVDIDFKS